MTNKFKRGRLSSQAQWASQKSCQPNQNSRPKIWRRTNDGEGNIRSLNIHSWPKSWGKASDVRVNLTLRASICIVDQKSWQLANHNEYSWSKNWPRGNSEPNSASLNPTLSPGCHSSASASTTRWGIGDAGDMLKMVMMMILLTTNKQITKKQST